MNEAKIRETKESKVEVIVDQKPMRDWKINTGIEFLNHMIETIALRACINIDVSVELKRFKLNHVIAEDVGITIGQALRNLVVEKSEGAGTGIMCIDEARTNAVISFEDRSNVFIERNCPGSKLEQVEDMLSADLVAFLEGMSQGGGVTIQLVLEAGEDPHHSWEAAFRALGLAIKEALTKNEWRTQRACVKG